MDVEVIPLGEVERMLLAASHQGRRRNTLAHAR
jgi:hypothetical protein